MMTKQEKQKMLRLELENKELREMNSKHISVYGDNIIHIIELEATMQLIKSALEQHEIPR
jgi:hypothetical protein